MLKHGSSHAGAVLICTLSSGFLIAMLRTYLPELLDVFTKISIFLCTLLHLPYPRKSVELILAASLMAMIWGMAFSFMHSDKK